MVIKKANKSKIFHIFDFVFISLYLNFNHCFVEWNTDKTPREKKNYNSTKWKIHLFINQSFSYTQFTIASKWCRTINDFVESSCYLFKSNAQHPMIRSRSCCLFPSGVFTFWWFNRWSMLKLFIVFLRFMLFLSPWLVTTEMMNDRCAGFIYIASFSRQPTIHKSRQPGSIRTG